MRLASERSSVSASRTEQNTTLPLWMYVLICAQPASANISTSSRIVSLHFPPTLAPRSNASFFVIFFERVAIYSTLNRSHTPHKRNSGARLNNHTPVTLRHHHRLSRIQFDITINSDHRRSSSQTNQTSGAIERNICLTRLRNIEPVHHKVFLLDQPRKPIHHPRRNLSCRSLGLDHSDSLLQMQRARPPIVV